MKKSFLSCSALLLAIFILATGCSMSSRATDFSGLSTPDGGASHISTSNIAIHGMFGSKPLIGNASLEQTVADFTAKAKAAGATKVRIVQSKKTALWFIFPPISFFLTPVFSNVAGDAIQS